MRRHPVVAVFNASPDIVDLLRFAFERAGFVAVGGTTFAIREGELDLEHFVHQHNPDVIVYDIAPPYEENWRLFQHMQRTPALKDRPVVLTTTNIRHVAQFAEPMAMHEIIGKPYDLNEVVNAAKATLPDGLRPPGE